MAPIQTPKLTHAFDLTVIGPPGFAAEASKHSARSVAHGQSICLSYLSSLLPLFHLYHLTEMVQSTEAR